MSHLSDLPNIGKVVESRLIEVDIKTPEELRTLGSKEAFIRLKVLDPGVCLSCLCGLEGAIQGIRWHQLPNGVKQDLKRFFDSVK